MNDILARFTSRKFLLAVFGLITLLFGDKLHLTPDQTNGIISVIIAFTAAEGVADAVTRYINIPDVETETSSGSSKSKKKSS